MKTTSHPALYTTIQANTRIYMLNLVFQHGESEYNVLGKIGGDAVLSARGERYAQALAAKINSMHIPDLRVLTSRLRRTIATARGIEAAQEHVAALNELYAGVCEGLSYEEMQEQYPQVREREIFGLKRDCYA